ncbi:MAG: cupin domain-containing protein [Steroidobacteraceae bacterium]
MSRKINLEAAPVTTGSRYPEPYDEPCRARHRTRLGDAAGLTQFGVNLLELPPGAWSSQRHWHSAEDELVYVVEGEVVLVTNAGEQTLRAGDSAGFKSGVADGHQLQNRSGRKAIVLEIGSRRPDEDEVDYPDIDLKVPRGRNGYTRKDGTRY